MAASKLSAVSLSKIVVDFMSSAELNLSILDLSKSESGAINSSDILPLGSITNAAKMFLSISTRC